MNRIFLPLILIALFFSAPLLSKEKIKVVAHRGYWKTEGSAQNSIASIHKAAPIKGIYGIEFDVHFTADNVPIVFHNTEVDGMKVQFVNYDDLKNITLANGEKIPTLYEFLDEAVQYENLKLIFELKFHATPERNTECAAMAVDIINKYNLTSRTEYISFDLDACKELIRVSPNTPVSYLTSKLTPKALKELGFDGLDYNFNALTENNQWIKEAQDLGLTVNVWTVNDPDKIRTAIGWGVDYITTDVPETVIEILSSK